MSHYIFTEIEGKEIILTPGSSSATISAISKSGFDIYGVYDAYLFHAGMSGTGQALKVNAKLAKKAYMHAIAWSKALEASFPKQCRMKIEELEKLEIDLQMDIPEELFGEQDLDKLVLEKKLPQRTLTDFQVDRSLKFLYNILHFTKSMYKYTRQGHTLEISFC